MRYFLLLMILSALFACKKQEVGTYTGDSSISFYRGEYEAVSTSFSFAFALKPQVRDTVYFRMRVTGAAADHPRKVSVKAVEGTTARLGIDYELPEVVLPAGALTLDYPVIVISSPEMLTKSFMLIAEVAENNDFKKSALGTVLAAPDSPFQTLNVKQIVLEITNRLVKPTYWDFTYFGNFSAAKLRFMIDQTGLIDFSEEAIGIDGIYNLPTKLQNLLNEYEAINGRLIDENGEYVIFQS